MTFLADAHQRGVLRQAGAVYQFRHIALQHHEVPIPVLSMTAAREEETLSRRAGHRMIDKV